MNKSHAKAEGKPQHKEKSQTHISAHSKKRVSPEAKAAWHRQHQGYQEPWTWTGHGRTKHRQGAAHAMLTYCNH